MDSFAGGVTRAAVWTGAGIEVRSLPTPRPRDGEVLVRVRLATVCGSDLHTVAGRRDSPCPSILGHEAVGDVVAVGSAARVSVGERVVWSVAAFCGTCDRCERGLTAKCRELRKIGHERFDGARSLSGGYAEHILLPDGVHIAPVPSNIPDAVAAPAACATATVQACVEAAGELAGRRVLLCGAGMLGVTAAAMCTEAGAEVLIQEPNPERLGTALRFGADRDDLAPVDVAIDFSGASAAVRNCLDRLDTGGVGVLAGSVLPGPAVPLDPESVVRRRLTVVGVHNYEPHHLDGALDFLSRTVDRYPWTELVAPPVGLEQTADMFVPIGPELRASIAP